MVESAEFFTRITLAVRDGIAMPDALHAAAQVTSGNAIPSAWLDSALASSASEAKDSAASKAHGLTCHVPDAFPAVCHLLLRHPDDAVAALTANVEAGGDSAARGLIIGMIHGARPDATVLPHDWLTGLRAHGEIQQLIETIHSHA